MTTEVEALGCGEELDLGKESRRDDVWTRFPHLVMKSEVDLLPPGPAASAPVTLPHCVPGVAHPASYVTARHLTCVTWSFCGLFIFYFFCILFTF